MKSSEELSVRELTEQINRGITKAIRYNEVSKMKFIRSNMTLFYSSYVRYKFSQTLDGSLDLDKFYKIADSLRIKYLINELGRIRKIFKSNWIKSE